MHLPLHYEYAQVHIYDLMQKRRNYIANELEFGLKLWWLIR